MRAAGRRKLVASRARLGYLIAFCFENVIPESRVPPKNLIFGAPRAAIAFLPIAWKRAWLSMLVAILTMMSLVAVGGGRFVGVCAAAAVLAVTIELGALWRLSLG